jgi:pyruvate formate lyase activating enzyme
LKAESPGLESAAGAPARWWHADAEAPDKLVCDLCPRYCSIGKGQAGFCYIRVNSGGKMLSLGYGKPAALQIDPIEKKPLNHFMPGSSILSIGTAGCNMGCKFCQNWEISKSKEDQVRSIDLGPDEVVDRAVRNGCPAIAFTYNEPTIWGEYVVDISRRARERGIKTVMVSNGYVTMEALPEIYRYIDAANIDLKAFTENFYRKVTLTHLRPVLDALVEIKKRGVWVEVTTLLIPTLNDALDEVRRLSRWVLRNLGADTPLHFTAFHPDFKLMNLPPTAPAIVEAARSEALGIGLNHVYTGNLRTLEGGITFCPDCAAPVIRRSWHRVEENRLTDGRCPCGASIAGYFPAEIQKKGRSRQITSLLQ